MVPRAEILCSIVVLSLLALNLPLEATRESRFFNKEPVYTNPNGGENGSGYTDSKEWYPTGTERGVENSYNANAYYSANEGQGNADAYVNRQGEKYRSGENGYAGDAQYFSRENSKYGSGYGSSGDWHGSNAGYGQGGEFASGSGKGSNGGYGGGYSNEFANGNGYGAGMGGGYGNGNGNGNGEYVSNNGYYQQNP